ncbi:MAG: hypothetical protein V1837_03750 [Candidatus Woesearchaeota archaeon]
MKYCKIPEPPVDPVTGLRIGTSNLVMSCLEDELQKVQKALEGTGWTVRQIPGVLPYCRIPYLLPVQSGKSVVYLAQISDPTGTVLANFDEKIVRRWFSPFDTVNAIFKLQSPDGQCLTIEFPVKDAGVYCQRNHK